jgi:hypothetical protein
MEVEEMACRAQAKHEGQIGRREMGRMREEELAMRKVVQAEKDEEEYKRVVDQAAVAEEREARQAVATDEGRKAIDAKANQVRQGEDGGVKLMIP